MWFWLYFASVLVVIAFFTVAQAVAPRWVRRRFNGQIFDTLDEEGLRRVAFEICLVLMSIAWPFLLIAIAEHQIKKRWRRRSS